MIGTLLKAVGPAVSGVMGAIGFSKPFRAGKAAAEGRELKNVSETAFDDALRLLTSPDHDEPKIRTAYESLKTSVFAPDFLRNDYVKRWLSEADVIAHLRIVVTAHLNETSSRADSSVVYLNERYLATAFASIPEANGVVSATIAMMVATINGGVKDSALASIVLALGSRINDEAAEFRGEVREEFRVMRSLLAPEEKLADDSPITSEVAVEWRAAFAGASNSLLQWPTVLGNQRHITRPELRKLMEKAQETSCAVALLGVPGAGKSALLASLGNALLNIPDSSVLAIKGDLLSAEVLTEEDLKHELGLPDLAEKMLKKLAAVGPTFLLIDQLDALAGHLDLKSSRLNVLLNLVRAVGNVENVHVFLSCRKFEFEHDIRLSHLGAESVELLLPVWDEVFLVLHEHGIPVAAWNSDAKEVLRVPQQLAIYMQLRMLGITEPFSNYTTMLDRLWSIRVLDVPGGDGAASLAFEIAETMAEMEVLWLAASRFDERIESLKLLLAAEILKKSVKGAIGFSHQTVFEHVLARNFSKQPSGLSNYVLARTDSLFVRPKLWAGLGFLRDAEPQTYLSEFSKIWGAPNVRKHLRFLLIEFLGSQVEPTDSEDILLADAFDFPEFQAIVLAAMVASQGWFRLFESQIRTAMVSEKLAGPCVPVLIAAWSFAPSKVVTLLREIWYSNGAFDKNILVVLDEAPLWDAEAKRLAVDVAKRLDHSALSWDYFIGAVGGADPEFAVDLLAVLLPRFSEVAVAEGLERKRAFDAEVAAGVEPDVVFHLNHNPAQPLDNMLTNNLWSTTLSLAETSPKYFLSRLWPWFLTVCSAFLNFSASSTTGLAYPLGYRLRFRLDEAEIQRTGHGSILDAIVYAVEDFAKSSPAEALVWATAQHHVELAPIQRLIAHAYSQIPQHASTEALKFLLGDHRRFHLGSSDASSTTLRLISACSPFWSIREVLVFTDAVNRYAPKRPVYLDDANAIRNWQRIVSRTRILLLRALPESKLTPEIKRNVEEGYRILRGSDEGEPTSEGGWIGSPMGATQFEQASTEDILNAFKRLPDETGWDHPKHFMQGGNIQLSREFAAFAKNNPQRAIDMLSKLNVEDAQRGAGYAVYALAAACDSEALSQAILELAKRGFGDFEFKEQVALAVDILLSRAAIVPDELVSLLDDWIWDFKPSNFGDETEYEAHGDAQEDQEDQEDDSEKFLLSGHTPLESVPGGVYIVLATTLNARYQRGEFGVAVSTLRRFLLTNKSIRIWQKLAGKMDVWVASETQGAKELVAEVLAIPGMAGTKGAAILMAKSYKSMPDQVIDCLRRWRESGVIRAQRGYGELIALLSLIEQSTPLFGLLLDELILEPTMSNAREGAAASAVRILWEDAALRDNVVTLIMRLLDKHEEAIWHLVFQLFRDLDAVTADTSTIRLIVEIAERINFAPPPKDSHVVECLAGFVPRYAVPVAAIAAQLIQLWKNDLGDMRTSFVLASRDIIDLSITLHRLSSTREQGIQMFEQLVEIGAYESRQVLDEIDNRIRTGRGAIKPRLSRVHRRRTKHVSG